MTRERDWKRGVSLCCTQIHLHCCLNYKCSLNEGHAPVPTPIIHFIRLHINCLCFIECSAHQGTVCVNFKSLSFSNFKIRWLFSVCRLCVKRLYCWFAWWSTTRKDSQKTLSSRLSFLNLWIMSTGIYLFVCLFVCLFVFAWSGLVRSYSFK